MRHVNAKQALPPDLLRHLAGEVRPPVEHCSGYIYVPRRDDFYDRRRAGVLELHRLGLPTDEIARRVHLCRRRIQQIVSEAETQG